MTQPSLTCVPTQHYLFLGVAMVAIVLAVYGRAVGFGYVDWDDTALVLNNPLLNPLLNPKSGEGIGRAWAAPYLGLYAPLTYTVYAALAWLARAAGEPLSPFYFHLTGVVCHALAAILLWSWLTRLGFTAWVGWTAAMVWAVHPLQVEPVAWVSGLNSVLAGLFGLLALLLGTRVRGVGLPNYAWLAMSTVAVVLSVTAKPSSVLLPVIGLVVHRLVLKATWRETLLLAIPWTIAVLPFVWIGSGTQIDNRLFTPPTFAERPLVALHAVGFYLTRTVLPIGLGVDYGQTPATVLTDRSWVGRGLVALAAVAAAVVCSRRRPGVTAGFMIFVAALLPVLGFVPFYFQAYSTVADRYAYLPLIGLGLGVAALLPTTWSVQNRGFWIGGLIVLSLAVVTFRQVGVWRDTATLFHHAYEVNPQSVAANGQIGLIAARSGDLTTAERSLAFTLERRPSDHAMRAEYADVLLRSGQPQRAADEFERSLQEQPNNASAQNGFGLALAAIGRDEAALLAFGRAWQLDPKVAAAPANAGDVLQRLGRVEQARGAYLQALRINPQYPRALAGLRALPASRPTTRP